MQPRCPTHPPACWHHPAQRNTRTHPPEAVGGQDLPLVAVPLQRADLAAGVNGVEEGPCSSGMSNRRGVCVSAALCERDQVCEGQKAAARQKLPPPAPLPRCATTSTHERPGPLPDCLPTHSPHPPVCVLWNLIVLSAVPPPVASRFAWKGHHARALTAAWWAVMRWVGRSLAASHTISRLSLPPLASCSRGWGGGEGRPCRRTGARERGRGAAPGPLDHRSNDFTTIKTI